MANITFLLLILIVSACSNNDAKINITAPNGETLTWLIQPIFDHNYIWHCSHCNVMSDMDIRNAEAVKRQLELFSLHHVPDTVSLCWGHGTTWTNLFFDPDNETFVIWQIGSGWEEVGFYTDFDEWTALLNTRNQGMLRVVRKINVDEIIESYDELWGYSWTHPIYPDFEGVSDERFALLLGDTILTDFVFGASPLRYLNAHHITIGEIIAVEYGGKWGILDKNATTILPFIFDGIEFISNHAAFVKVDGLWGILDVDLSIMNNLGGD